MGVVAVLVGAVAVIAPGEVDQVHQDGVGVATQPPGDVQQEGGRAQARPFVGGPQAVEQADQPADHQGDPQQRVDPDHGRTEAQRDQVHHARPDEEQQAGHGDRRVGVAADAKHDADEGPRQEGPEHRGDEGLENPPQRRGAVALGQPNDQGDQRPGHAERQRPEDGLQRENPFHDPALLAGPAAGGSSVVDA